MRARDARRGGARAGQSAKSAITGVVKDTSGAVLPGATVEAASEALIEKAKGASPCECGSLAR